MMRCVRGLAGRGGATRMRSTTIAATAACPPLLPSPRVQAWDVSLRGEIEAEAAATGGCRVLHAHVSKDAPTGDVYLMMGEFAAAAAVLAAFRGRTFAGRVLHAEYVPIEVYLALFPEIAKLASGS